MGNCMGGTEQLNPGAVLDRVVSQASGDDDCLLYKLANYKKGGELIDAFNTGGAVEVDKLIRDQFGMFMYKEGKGQIISRTEYLRWKFRNQKHVVIPVLASGPNDPLAKWKDHEASWQMQYRGSLGESLLHLLIICNTKLHSRLARILLKYYPKLAVDVVEGEEYLGASALHLAIAYLNNDMVHLLIESGAHIEQRATGSFFLPRDQQRVHPAKETDYEGLAYLGEYPLAWAACVNNESVYNLLLDKGADPDKQDSFGNMVLHMVVVTDQLGMYGYALRHPHVVASSSIENNQGLTPLTLACILGRASVFREMLELSAREFWRYSNITCSGYPLNALDTIMPDGRTNWNSALFMILAGSKEDHLNMLEGGIIQRLLEEKWKTFAQNQFLKRISIAFLHLLTMSLAVYLRPSDRNQSLVDYSRPADVIRLGFELGTILCCLLYIFVQQGEEIKNQGIVTYLKQLPQSPPKLVFLIGNFLILLCVPVRMSGDVRLEESLLSFAMVCSWFFMMFFAGAIKLTGPFVTMVYSMITGDMLTFGIIYTIFLLGFSQSFFYLYKSHPDVQNTLFHGYPQTWMALYQMTLGSYSYNDLSLTAYPIMAKIVFITFMILVPILLLNMLIAMMGNTYSEVIERSEKEWVKQWAKIVVALERAVSQEDAKHYINEYSIKLGGTDPTNEIRGVMVIKSMSKTRANQRKGALSNWKRVGKVTITALKKRGMTGEELRIIMWGHRNSVSTPIVQTPRSQSLIEGISTDITSALDQLSFGDVKNLNGHLPALDQPPDYSTLNDGVCLSVSVPPFNSNLLAVPIEPIKVKRRNNVKLGDTPKIIIFSDKKDLIRVNLDSDESESELYKSDEEERRTTGRRKSIGGGVEVGGFADLATISKSPPNLNLTPTLKPSLDSESKSTLDKSQLADSSSKSQLTSQLTSSKPTSKPQLSLTKEGSVNLAYVDDEVGVGQEGEKPPKITIAFEEKKERPKSSKTKSRDEEEKKKTERAKSAKISSTAGASGGNKIEPSKKSGSEEEKRRPLTGNDRWSTQEITGMNKLVAWDRDEDDV